MKGISGYRIEIVEPEGISDSGEETYNFFGQEGIRNVIPIKPAGCPSILIVDLMRPAEGHSS